VCVCMRAKFQKATIGFVLSVCLCTWNSLAPTGLNIWVFFENLYWKLKLLDNLTRIVDTLHEDTYTFMVVSHWIVIRMRNVSEKLVEKMRKKKPLFYVNFFSEKSCHFWDNVEKIWYSQTGHRWQYDTAHVLCMLDN
jgi:hypothetical protein